MKSKRKTKTLELDTDALMSHAFSQGWFGEVHKRIDAFETAAKAKQITATETIKLYDEIVRLLLTTATIDTVVATTAASRKLIGAVQPVFAECRGWTASYSTAIAELVAFLLAMDIHNFGNATTILKRIATRKTSN